MKRGLFVNPPATLALFVALAVSTCTGAPAQTEVSAPQDGFRVPEADDAFHYNGWKGTPYSGAYTEWWYFNLYDRKKDLQAIFSYQVVDPENLTGKGVSFVSAAAYKGSEIINTFDLYPLSLFCPSYTSANVAMGPDTITVLDRNTYQIIGSSSDGRISWDLLYDRESDPWFAADRVNVAQASWEKMSWLLYMPRGHVTGTLVVDGQQYTVESSGYHDHNWGEWDLATVRWNWAQVSKPGLAFDLGDFIGNPNGRAAIDINGRRTVFSANQYKLVHTKWAYDAQNGTSYPTQSILTADNGFVRLSVTMDVEKTDPLPAIPGLIIYEQPTHFAGTVTSDIDGHESALPFEGNGFKEYTASVNVNPR